MRRLRHAQPSLRERSLADEVAELWKPWMREVDALQQDDELLSAVFDARGHRHKESCRLGRPQIPAEVVLRMLWRGGGSTQPRQAYAGRPWVEYSRGC